MSIYIIVLGAVALFLLFKMRDVLGKPTGRENLEHPFKVIRDTGGDQESAPDFSNAEKPEIEDSKPLHEDPEVAEALSQIRGLDRSFHPTSFLDGSQVAFEMVLSAFASGDKDTLRGLLSTAVFEDFEAAIDARVDAGETMQTTLVGFSNVEITDAELSGQTASVTVRYQTEQISVTKDEAGEVVSGSATYVAKITDVWTYARKVTSSDPNWSLVATESEDEEAAASEETPV